jgi:D-3-phosphoglycerate dehydrogenase
MLALLRGLKQFDRLTAEGYWEQEMGPRIRRLSTLTVDVLAFGSIGRAVADCFCAFGADILTSDP